MRLNRTYDNNIASYGYNTSEAFMTVHASQNGMYTVDGLKGRWIYVDSSHMNRIKKIANDPRNPLISVSVYRTDITAGRTHVAKGIIKDVYVPVNVTTADIASKQFVMTWRRINKNEYYVLLEKAGVVRNLNDITKLRKQINEAIENLPEEFSDTVIETGKCKIHVIGKVSQYSITWKSNLGKRILAVFKDFTTPANIKVGLGIDASKANTIHSHWKLMEVENKWYRWTYINGDCICTEEFSPDWFAHHGDRMFIMSQVNSDGDIIATLFYENGGYTDVKISNHHVLSDFDLKREVLEEAPFSTFRIPKQVRDLREDKFRE